MDIIKAKEILYRRSAFKYGVITLCYLIDIYSKEENYEECQIILDVINSLSEKYEMWIPKKFDDQAKLWLKVKLKKITGTNGETIIHNLPFYAGMIKSEINDILID